MPEDGIENKLGWSVNLFPYKLILVKAKASPWINLFLTEEQGMKLIKQVNEIRR